MCVVNGWGGEAGLGEGEGEGFVYFCFLRVTAPPEPTGGKEKAERESGRDDGGESGRSVG